MGLHGVGASQRSEQTPRRTSSSEEGNKVESSSAGNDSAGGVQGGGHGRFPSLSLLGSRRATLRSVHQEGTEPQRGVSCCSTHW
ncbi:hypothetical protein CTRI78_v006557 [Colletotrichum trifolii]|uniref:Uncharacterized protein n=1 Tax=Colletotrichum trifolii TaxID=5466 RepID=A0A4R8RCC3_COLTR|nr:hypothetical protein CTRI78_v006557 [Colletotrichum trifolii]